MKDYDEIMTQLFDLRTRVCALEKSNKLMKNIITSIKTEDVPLYEKIADKMLHLVYDWWLQSYKTPFEEKGLDAKIQAYANFMDQVEKTGFVTLSIENGRGFLYAVNPSEFISEWGEWNYIQKHIEEEFNITLAIGAFRFTQDKETLIKYGNDIAGFVTKFLNEFPHPLDPKEDKSK